MTVELMLLKRGVKQFWRKEMSKYLMLGSLRSRPRMPMPNMNSLPFVKFMERGTGSVSIWQLTEPLMIFWLTVCMPRLQNMMMKITKIAIETAPPVAVLQSGSSLYLRYCWVGKRSKAFSIFCIVFLKEAISDEFYNNFYEQAKLKRLSSIHFRLKSNIQSIFILFYPPIQRKTQPDIRCQEHQYTKLTECTYFCFSNRVPQWVRTKLLKKGYDVIFRLQLNNIPIKDLKPMTKILAKIKGLLKSGDLFTTSQLLRYRKETDYGTATGGFVSIAVFIVFAALFWNLGIQTANMELINSSMSIISESDPSPVKITAGTKGGFMFGVAIIGLNLNDPLVTYFNITLTQRFFGPLYTPINATQIPLVQCTPAHFAFNQEIENYFKRFPVTNALCPTLDSKFQVGGRVTSDIFSFLSLQVSKCNSSVNPRCASDAQMAFIQAQLGYFTIGLPMINTLINAGDLDYVRLYVQDRNEFYFTTTQGMIVNGEISQYNINTDISLMPYQNILSESFVACPERFIAKVAPVVADNYAQFRFIKASNYRIYTRSFNKVDDFFSYVGGLISVIIVFFFFVGCYSAANYMIEMAGKTFQMENNKPVPSTFNFFYFIAARIKDILAYLPKKFQWKKVDEFRKCKSQMVNQLDVSYLMQRIVFLEQAISSILPEHQLKALFLTAKPTLQDVSKRRKYFKMLKILKKHGLSQRVMQENGNSSLINASNSDFPNKATKSAESQQSQQSQSSDSSSQESDNDEAREHLLADLQQTVSLVSKQEHNKIGHRIMSLMDESVLKALKLDLTNINNFEASNHHLNELLFQDVSQKADPEPNQKQPFQYLP